MIFKTQDIKNFLGKTIADSHQRCIGKIVSMYTNTKNEVTSVEIETSNGDFTNCPSGKLVIEGDALIYMHNWEIEADELRTELELRSKRVKALDELYRSGDIEKEIYDELKREHGSSIEKLEDTRKKLVQSLSERKVKLHDQVRELETSLANNKMQRASEEIGDEAYRVMCDSIRSGLKRLLSEKRHVEEMDEELKRPETQPYSSTLPSPILLQPKTITSGDMMVVHLKEKIF
jgi:predicted RNase H-like nuclease (RuvC/YqgF family)